MVFQQRMLIGILDTEHAVSHLGRPAPDGRAAPLRNLCVDFPQAQPSAGPIIASSSCVNPGHGPWRQAARICGTLAGLVDKPVKLLKALPFPGERLVAVFDVVDNTADQIGRSHVAVEWLFEVQNHDGE